MRIYIYIYTCTPTPFFCFINVLGKHFYTYDFHPFYTLYTIFIHFLLCPDHIYPHHFCIHHIYTAGATVKGSLLFCFFKNSVHSFMPKISTILTLRSHLFEFLVFVFIFQTPQYLRSLHIYIYIAVNVSYLYIINKAAFIIWHKI